MLPQIDTVTMEDVDRLAREPHSIVITCNLKLNLDRLVDRMWEALQLTRVYTKKRVRRSRRCILGHRCLRPTSRVVATPNHRRAHRPT